MKMKDFRKLKVWGKSHHQEEAFGLTSQIRRASLSIPSNIAEGCGRSSDTELARFFQISLGSASELEYQILLARELGLLNDKNHERLNSQIVEIKCMLTSLIQKLKADR